MADQPIYYPTTRAQQENPMDSFARAFAMGMQMKQQRQQMEMEKEDRALRIEALQQEAKRLKLHDKLQAFQMLQGQLGPMQEQPGQEIPSLFSAGGQMGVPGPSQQVEGQHPEFDFSQDFGVPGMQMRPQNYTDVQSMLQAQKQRELQQKIAEATGMERAKLGVQSEPVTSEVSGLGPVTGPAGSFDQVLQGLFTGQNQAAAGQRTAAEGAADRASREKVAGQGRAHDFAIEKFKAGLKGTEPEKPLSGEAAKVYSIATTMKPEIEKLKKALSDPKTYRKNMAGILTGTDRRLSKLVDQVADKVGRLRSGGAINRDEEKKFKGQIASAMDIFTGDSKGALEALDGILSEADSVANEIRPPRQGGTPKVRVYNPSTGRLE